MTEPGIEAAALKPCPFCGSEAEIERYGDHSRSTIYQCTSCSCSLESGEEWGHGRRWNERACPVASGDLRERIARIKADPGDGTLQPDIGYVLARGFEAMGWERPQSAAQDMLDTIPLVDPNRVKEAMEDAKGFWKSCCGCHETNEGYPTGPRSIALKCHLGLGCHECGGIGAVWDNTDYSGYGDSSEALPASGDLRERIAETIRQWTSHSYMQLHAGEMTAQERRTVCAVVEAIERQVCALPGLDEEAIR